MIRSIYHNRTFLVKDGKHESNLYPQGTGVVQGFLLSPFLFTIVMAVLIKDTKDWYRSHIGLHGGGKEAGDVEEIRCADDTPLVNADDHCFQVYTECVASIGSEYGREHHWKRSNYWTQIMAELLKNRRNNIDWENALRVPRAADIC